MGADSTTIQAPPGGVMTVEAGRITGRVVITRRFLQVLAAREGAAEAHTVQGSLTRADATIASVAARLAADPERDDDGNPMPSSLVGFNVADAATRRRNGADYSRYPLEVADLILNTGATP